MASTSVPAAFTSACPVSMNFGYAHGTSPVAATIQLTGSVFVPKLGTIQTLQLGNSIFTGFVVGNEYDPIDDLSTVHMVDWRDRLHDFHVAAAFNCEEQDGRFYHILPHNWEIQRKTYVTRQLGQFDFNDFQRLPKQAKLNLQIAKNGLFSALSILDWIATQRGFVVIGDTLAFFKLATSYPLNLDWNSGSIKAIDAMQQIMAKCGTQMTFYGRNQCYLTIRGYSENIFTQGLVFGSLDDFCLLGVSTGKIGQELNELGRRVKIIGDRNKYEYVYLCRQNWNPNWTYEMAASELALSAILNANNLSVFDRVGDMPAIYHDYETWLDYEYAGNGAQPARKTRNDMLIKDYIDKVVYRVYVADAGYISKEFTSEVDDFSGTFAFLDQAQLKELPSGLDVDIPLDYFQRTLDYDAATNNFLYPPSRTLVTDSNLPYIIYSTTDDIYLTTQPQIHKTQTTFIPRANGASLDVEEVTDPNSGEVQYRVRVFFDQMQFFETHEIKSNDGHVIRKGDISPDLVLVRLAVDADIYSISGGEGDQSQAARVREQLINVPNLYRAFVDGKEVSILRENVQAYWDKNFAPQPTSFVPVKADDVAISIGRQALAHYAVTRSGSVHYDDICGTTPDGLIDSVVVNFSALPGQGITEDVNFTTGFAEDTNFRHPFPVRVSRAFKDTDELLIDLQRELDKQQIKQNAQPKQASSTRDTGVHERGGRYSPSQRMTAYARDGITEIEVKQALLAAGADFQVGDVIVLGKPGGTQEPPVPPTT